MLVIRSRTIHPQFAQVIPLYTHNLTPILKSSELLHSTLEKDSLYTESDLRTSLQITCSCHIFSHPGLTPYHPQSPYWYKLGSAKRNHTSYL